MTVWDTASLMLCQDIQQTAFLLFDCVTHGRLWHDNQTTLYLDTSNLDCCVCCLDFFTNRKYIKLTNKLNAIINTFSIQKEAPSCRSLGSTLKTFYFSIDGGFHQPEIIFFINYSIYRQPEQTKCEYRNEIQN